MRTNPLSPKLAHVSALAGGNASVTSSPMAQTHAVLLPLSARAFTQASRRLSTRSMGRSVLRVLITSSALNMRSLENRAGSTPSSAHPPTPSATPTMVAPSSRTPAKHASSPPLSALAGCGMTAVPLTTSNGSTEAAAAVVVEFERRLVSGPRIALACAKFADSLDAETVEAIPQKSVRIIAVDLIALPRTEECCDADDADDAESRE
mmetsp:Transcript_1188/g.2870  ORF Transcript_1188/g.2870 Transcript_1188/m.2870 type:complete len:207 (+) Transcript_1188:418-1038(+)